MLSQKEFERLAKARGHGLVSIYMPTHRYGQAVREDPIRLKNLVSEAVSRAAENGTDERKVERLLLPTQELIDDKLFWQHQGDGLAIFASDNQFDVHRLSTPVEELAYAGERFCLRPLLPERSEGRHFYVLALSQKRVRLLECTRDGAREMDLHDIPERLEDALGYDWEQRSLQFHSSSASVGATRSSAVFHGHGSGSDETKSEIERFLRMVDDGLNRLLRDDRSPLLVAAVDYVNAMYSSISRYPSLVAGGLDGNPEHLRAEELQARALERMKPYLDRSRRESVERFQKAAHSEKTLHRIGEVLPALKSGRVGTLLVRSDRPLWGRFDAADDSTEVHESRHSRDDDLLDLAVSYACATGAKPVAVQEDELPEDAMVASVLRF